MRLEKQGGKYICISEFNERFIPKQAGFDWNADTKHWETDSPFVASNLAEYAEGELMDALFIIRNQANSSNINENTSKMPVDQFYSPGDTSLYPFQQNGIAWLLGRKFSMLSDGLGMGKTAQAIGVINHADPPIEKALIVCPASLRINWRKELEFWLKRPRAIYIVESQKGWSPFASIYIINYDILHKFQHELREFTWDLLIADEAHYLRNPKTKRTQHLLGKKWRYSRKQEWEIPPVPANRKIFITGTPIVNRPVELWPLVNALDPVNFGSYDKFTRRYCGARRGRWGWDTTGATHLDELKRILRSTIMLRRKKDEVLTDLPSKITSIIELPHDGNGNAVKAEMKAFKQHESSLQELVVSRELAKSFANESDYKDSVNRLKTGVLLAFSQLSSERKRVAVAKVPLVIEYVDNIDEKVVIFCHHKDVVHRLRSHFKQSCVWLNGECSLNDRQRAIEDFQFNPDIKVFIGSIQAAGVGITLTASRIAIFAELDWVPGNMEQASDRLHRIGQKDTVLIQYLVFDQSVDAKIAKTLVQKQAIINDVLDPDDETFPLPFDELPSTLTVSFNEIAKQSENITHETKEIIRSTLYNLLLVASDKINRFDKIIIDNLLMARYLSSKEAALGRSIIITNKTHVDPKVIMQIQD